MKKITLLVLAFVFGIMFQGQSQETMTQNTDQVIIPGGVSCGGGDNQWYREYDFIVTPPSFTGDVMLLGAEFAVGVIDFDEDITVNVYDWTGGIFPTGFDAAAPPTVIATATVTVGPGDVDVITSVTFDTPAIVAEGSNIIVQVVQPTQSGNNLFLGVTAEETAFSWISSAQCGLANEPITMDDVGFPDAHHIINLVVDVALAVGDNIGDIASVYPNPTSNVLNVKIPANVEIYSSNLYNILGQDTGLRLVNGTMNTSGLAEGVYILNVKTSAGDLTQQVVKQ